jgi:maltose alpha-D-glucosyltransferase/alpha-amylase
VGHSFFSRDGKGNINDFLDEFLIHRDSSKGKGYVGLITGNHDIPRLAYRRDLEEQKAAMVLIFTMAGVPFVYYGDEIGMDYIPGLPSKEGGYIRTGSRTPMQWNSEKNHGFSDSDTPYLPTDSKPNAPTVEQQLADPDSLLQFVKQLIAYHKENPALWADGELEILNPGYPFVYTRSSGDHKVLIAIDPSDGPHYCAIPAFRKTVFSRNAQLRDGLLVTEGVSFLVAEM